MGWICREEMAPARKLRIIGDGSESLTQRQRNPPGQSDLLYRWIILFFRNVIPIQECRHSGVACFPVVPGGKVDDRCLGQFIYRVGDKPRLLAVVIHATSDPQALEAATEEAIAGPEISLSLRNIV